MIEEISDRLIPKQISFKITYRFIIFLCFISGTMYLVCKALIEAYDPILASISFIVYILSYGFAITLINREEK